MSDSNADRLSQDVAFDLLSNARRRFVLRRLQETSGEVELGDLAAELAAKENEVPVEELSSQQRKRTYVSLYQTHIPKMVDAGVITYDVDDGTVAPTNRVAELSSYFRSETDTPAWEFLYGALAAGGIALYLVALTVDVPFLETYHVGLLALVAVLLLSAIHYVYTNERRGSNGLVPVDEER